MRPITTDLAGVSYFGGKVTVLRRDPTNPRMWICKCFCGTEFAAATKVLHKRGRKGCSQRCSHQTHGFSGVRSTKEYTAWKSMRQRCNNQKDQHYKDYGARGITYCDRWGDFPAFLAAMGPCPPTLTLERVDVNKGYGPENCKWASTAEQNANKRTVRRLTFHGSTKTIPEWSVELGIPAATLNSRLFRGWSHEKTLSAPVQAKYITR